MKSLSIFVVVSLLSLSAFAQEQEVTVSCEATEQIQFDEINQLILELQTINGDKVFIGETENFKYQVYYVRRGETQMVSPQIYAKKISAWTYATPTEVKNVFEGRAFLFADGILAVINCGLIQNP